MHRYTREQIQFLSEIAEGKTIKEIHNRFIERYGANVTPESVKGIMYRNKIKTGMQGYSTRFKKGAAPHNKGKKMPHNSSTQYKKGNLPHSHRPIGSENVKEGYVWIKVAEPNKWKKKHHYLWEKVNGPIPKGKVLRFADGNKMNVTLDNLFLTPRSACTSVVKRGLEHENPDLNVTTHTVVELELTIRDLEKQNKG